MENTINVTIHRNVGFRLATMPKTPESTNNVPHQIPVPRKLKRPDPMVSVIIAKNAMPNWTELKVSINFFGNRWAYGFVSLTGAGIGAMTITGGGTVLPRFWIGCNGEASCSPDECGMKSMALKQSFSNLRLDEISLHNNRFTGVSKIYTFVIKRTLSVPIFDIYIYIFMTYYLKGKIVCKWLYTMKRSILFKCIFAIILRLRDFPHEHLW